MPPKKPNGKQVPVSSLKHKDKRTNIPTRELQDSVKDEEKSPRPSSSGSLPLGKKLAPPCERCRYSFYTR